MTAATTHLVFKTHLDVGFTDLAANVVDRYVTGFIPSALAVAAELRAIGGPERFVWTTGSWLVDTFLERADTAGRRRMEEGIEAGDIAWHALPFTMHSELCDRSLFAHGLSIAARLDARFGRRTIAAKMTDVPGHTRGIVPLLAEAGVELLHIGVNPACPAPEVPPVFRWRSPDGSELVVAYQQGGYGGLVTVDGLADTMLVAHTDDNKGPQTVDQVLADFARARAEAPGSEVVASTLDAFAAAVRPVRAGLPEVDGELGDTWIHGVGTDPQKVARFRAVSRLRNRWIADGDDPAEPAFAAASTALLLVAEHTWGLDEKITLPDDERYAAAGLAELRAEPAGVRFESSWAEQRAYVDDAVARFPARRRAEAEEVLGSLGPQPWEGHGATSVPTDEPFIAGPFTIVVDGATGALAQLRDRATGRDWAGPDHPLGRYRYQTFGEADYDRFYAGYNRPEPHDEWWAVLDYTKPGIGAAGARAAWWDPTAVDVMATAHSVWVALTMPAEAVAAYGCPPTVVERWSFEDDTVVALSVEWHAKAACRLPEAAWVGFTPAVDGPERWVMDKLGQAVSPLDVVSLGNRHLHAVGRGVRHEGADATFHLDTLDAPLVAPGRPHLLDPADDEPDLAAGMHVNLHNNVWGTNFPMWNEGPARFRFTLRFA